MSRQMKMISGIHASACFLLVCGGVTGAEDFRPEFVKQLGSSARSVSGARPMGHCKGKDNVKKRAVRRKKTERLALAKSVAAAAK